MPSTHHQLVSKMIKTKHLPGRILLKYTYDVRSIVQTFLSVNWFLTFATDRLACKKRCLWVFLWLKSQIGLEDMNRGRRGWPRSLACQQICISKLKRKEIKILGQWRSDTYNYHFNGRVILSHFQEEEFASSSFLMMLFFESLEQFIAVP